MLNTHQVTEPAVAGDDGRRASFETEALVHIDALFRVAVRLLRNAADAEDLVQDTLLQAYRAWDQYERGTNARGWLIATMRHLFINQYRLDQRRREILATNFPAVAASAPALDDSVDDEVARAIDALPLSYREIVTLRDVEDLPYDEIAALLKIPVGTVKSRLNRARTELQRRLRGYAISLGVIPPDKTLTVSLSRNERARLAQG